MPTATPMADSVDARGPAASALRMISAVSGPGVAMRRADSATHAISRPSTSTYFWGVGFGRGKSLTMLA
jgi:hypothetical protein